MKEIILHTHFRRYTVDELSEADRNLIDNARQAALGAYAPYSHFQVGAAIRLADGTVVTGSNQENAAYPSGLCAERVALFAAGSQYPHQPVDTLALIACQDGCFLPSPVTPCGACRQVMLESSQRSGQALRLLLCGDREVLEVSNATDLLPLAFGTEAFDHE